MSDDREAPRCGDVWWADLDPVRGHEQGRRRPVLVVSVDQFNHLAHGLVWLVPITTRPQIHKFSVVITPPEGGLTRTSMALCHHLRTVSVERLERRLGMVSEATSRSVLRCVCLILGAEPPGRGRLGDA